MSRWDPSKNMVAVCHPDRPHESKNLCRSCYRKQPYVKAQAKAHRNTPARRERIREYERGPVKAASFRRYRHGFDEIDEQRFRAAVLCDWCHFPFNGETPYIDHDHSCCNKPRGVHCHKCTRGFVHHRCNILAIAYCEWIEKDFGYTNPVLVDYRKRFPRRRT